MKKILLSLLVVVAVGGATIAATSAYFTSQSILGASTLASGTLIVSAKQGGSSVLNLGTVGNMAPGDETSQVVMDIKNDGTLNLGWVGYFQTGGDEMEPAIYIKEAQMEFFKPNGETWEPLDHFISNGTGFGTWGGTYTALANSDPMNVVTIKSWNSSNAMGAGGGVQMGALKPNYLYRMTFTLGLAPLAGNSYQGKTMSIAYKVLSTQINADALDALFTSDSRLNVPGHNHVTWLEQQIAKQN